MSANPTRVDWEATASDASSPLRAGNRALESIARQDGMRALLAFSELREQIRNRRAATGRDADRDLFETERFIRDEVLQLICDRVQTITRADGILIALPAESVVDGPPLVCHASAGPIAIEHGAPLLGASEFLQDCLESGNILRCDDCEIDTRVEMDFARKIGARSTVLVPLRGRNEQLGVLQAFSRTPWAFTDHDIRCFDLFSELVLSALKPEDQDRRIHWLSDIAGEVLHSKPVSQTQSKVVETVAAATSVFAPAEIRSLIAELPVKTGLAPSSAATIASISAAPQAAPDSLPKPSGASSSSEAVVLSVPNMSTGTIETPEFAKSTDQISELTLVPVATHDSEAVSSEDVDDDIAVVEPTRPAQPRRLLFFPHRGAVQPTSQPRNLRPILNVAMGLMAVAALFSVGAWWGMRIPGKAARETAVSTSALTSTAPGSVTTPGVPRTDVLLPVVSDNLMSPANVGADATVLTPVEASKLATLPKITGVRHWSSSMGSTVVIDMEDQVPYEVHRLMSPERIYFDLHDTVLASDLDGKTMDVGDASLTRVRVAQPVAGITRIVLDTKDGSNFSVSMESSPYRLVVELRGSDKSLAANGFAPNHPGPSAAAANRIAAAASPTPAPKAAAVAALTPKPVEQLLPVKTGKFRIVLDAGHGGWDLGTVGRQGLLEKDLVLDVTQRLGKLLQSRLGSDVMFTRTSDNYLPLDQRADFANQSQADLFVSVHANYSSSAAARGVETYYTNLFSAPGSKEVEKHDDGTFAKLTPVSLSGIRLHDKIEESKRLAASVQHSLYATLAATSPDIRNRGTKESAFVVLTGTTMPAILTEISFVSSPADERNLQSATYRQQIAEALYKGIARYQETAPRSKSSQVTTASARR